MCIFKVSARWGLGDKRSTAADRIDRRAAVKRLADGEQNAQPMKGLRDLYTSMKRIISDSFAGLKIAGAAVFTATLKAFGLQLRKRQWCPVPIPSRKRSRRRHRER